MSSELRLDMFQLAFTRATDQLGGSFPSRTCRGTLVSDKTMEQRPNMKFYVKISKDASETSALLTLACDEYPTKKSIAFD
jgi:hypothetical protein